MAITNESRRKWQEGPGSLKPPAMPQPGSGPAPVPQPPQVPQPGAPPQPTTITAPGQGWDRQGNSAPPSLPGQTPTFAPTSRPAGPTDTPFMPGPGSARGLGGDSQLFTTNTPSGPGGPGAPGQPQPGGGSIFDQPNPEAQLAFIQAHPEQFDSRLSPEQWRAWLPDLDRGCPGRRPFRTSRPGPGGQTFGGAERCVEKPDDCPEGYRVIGNDASGSARCLPQDSAEFRGGMGGLGGAGGPGGNMPGGSGGGGGLGTATGGFGDVDAMLRRIIEGQLQNPTSRYTPENMQRLLGQTRATAEDQRQRVADQVTEDAAARGVLGSGATGTALANAAIAANRTVAGEQANLDRAKIDADFEDRRAAMQDAFNYLNSARDWAYKQQMTALQRQQFDANLALAYARMQQEWDQMQAEWGYRFLDGGM